MFSGRHPRIIVQRVIPSLLGTYANVSQAFEWLNRAYAQRDGRLVDTKADPLLRGLHGGRGPPVFALFIGVAMSITAFPVLARILTDQGLQKTPIGVLALTCAAIDDVTA